MRDRLDTLVAQHPELTPATINRTRELVLWFGQTGLTPSRVAVTETGSMVVYFFHTTGFCNIVTVSPEGHLLFDYVDLN